jgi:plasmid stabilization system protein ParE
MAAIHWTVGASDDLRELVEHIGRDSPRYAAAFAARVVSSVKVLRRFPTLGRVVPEYGDETIREVIVGSYRVVYRLRAGDVGILAVVHAARDLTQKLGDSPWDMG